MTRTILSGRVVPPQSKRFTRAAVAAVCAAACASVAHGATWTNVTGNGLWSDPPPASVAVVSHTRPFAMAGDDHPRPATGTFHTTFLVSLHSSGRPRSVEWPCPVGPRNSGQSSAASKDDSATISAIRVRTGATKRV